MLKFWKRKNRKVPIERYYGGDLTIHDNAELDVEVDKSGKVVSVWFRCQPIAFRQADVDDRRANEMQRMYDAGVPGLTGLELSE